MKSKIAFKNINYRKARLCLATNMNETDQRTSPLWRILPRRTSRGGVRPGITASPDNEEHWYFPNVELTELEKRMVVATVVKVGVLVMMNTHMYTWNGNTFLQKAGGPIGLRSTCAVARVVMNEWDSRWLELCSKNNIKIGRSNRYMDDIRAFLKALREGWRWSDGELCYKESWETEDRMSGVSAARRSANILVGMMNDIFPFLSFTIELGEDFPDGKLPSLDTKVWVMDGWRILYEFFEKTMATNLMVEAGSALSKEVKLATLAEEISRRLRTTSLELEQSCRLEILERACVKMKTSGHVDPFIRQAVEQGIRAFEEKVSRSRLEDDHPGYQPLFPKAGWKRDLKSKEKALKRGNWFKGPSGKEECWKGVTKTGGVRKKPFQKAGARNKLKKAATTVVFVPSTRGSTLIKSLRDEEDKMAEITGFRIKYQEAGGSVLYNAFDKNLGKGLHCGRPACPPCDNPGKREDCKSKNLVYESRCFICNPEPSQERYGSADAQPAGTSGISGCSDIPREGIYIGETSRSLHERALEHIRDAKAFSHKSHIVQHWMTSHPSLPSPPRMNFSITAQYRDCLSRQIGEALRINYTKDNILNSKSEYMSNTVSRLTIEEDAWERKQRSRKEEEDEEMNKRKVEEFMKVKSVQQATQNILAGGSSVDTTLSVTVPGTGPCENDDNTAKQDVWAPISSQHITLSYETDEDEFIENDSDMKEDDKSVSEYITDEDEFSPGSPSNGLSSTQPVTLGQSNGQPGDTLQFPAECPQVQDEHPWLKTVCEEDAEEGDGGIETETVYETDEEECSNTANPSILPGGSRQDTTPAVPALDREPGKCRKAAKRKVSAKEKCSYNLAYFNLWWRRMLREGEKEEKERAQREGAVRRKETVKRRILMRKERRNKTALMSEVDEENESNSQEYRSLEDDNTIGKENSVRANMPNYSASVSQLGGEVLGKKVIYERSQETNDDEIIHAQHQGIFIPNNDGLAPGSA